MLSLDGRSQSRRSEKSSRAWSSSTSSSTSKLASKDVPDAPEATNLFSLSVFKELVYWGMLIGLVILTIVQARRKCFF